MISLARNADGSLTRQDEYRLLRRPCRSRSRKGSTRLRPPRRRSPACASRARYGVFVAYRAVTATGRRRCVAGRATPPPRSRSPLRRTQSHCGGRGLGWAGAYARNLKPRGAARFYHLITIAKSRLFLLPKLTRSLIGQTGGSNLLEGRNDRGS